ncbi:MAG: flagellar biosynthetic protein FliQ [Alphaproteobacteria bacterium]
MTGPETLDIARVAIVILLKATVPLMGVGLAIGLVVAFFQALTQIQEQSLAFVPKIVAMFLALIVFLPFIGQLMANLMETVVDRIIAG